MYSPFDISVKKGEKNKKGGAYSSRENKIEEKRGRYIIGNIYIYMGKMRKGGE